jgi:hypothetical protein
MRGFWEAILLDQLCLLDWPVFIPGFIVPREKRAVAAQQPSFAPRWMAPSAAVPRLRS